MDELDYSYKRMYGLIRELYELTNEYLKYKNQTIEVLLNGIDGFDLYFFEGQYFEISQELFNYELNNDDLRLLLDDVNAMCPIVRDEEFSYETRLDFKDQLNLVVESIHEILPQYF